jgi:hypothetical protein
VTKRKRAPRPKKPQLSIRLERISTLKDFLRWLVLREQFEIEQNVPEAQRFAHRWNIFPYEGAIFVGIVTGLTGQEILDRFPELDLPVSLPESEELPSRAARSALYAQHLLFRPVQPRV